MVKKIKRFIVFCLFSFFFSLLSGKVEKAPVRKDGTNDRSWNSANAGACCSNGICTRDDGSHYCC